MQDSTFWILVVLLEGEAHGYAIAQSAKELSDGACKLGAGTLYTALERLCSEGLITQSKQTIENGRARNHYRLEKLGKSAIQDEIARRDEMSRIAKARLKLARGNA